MGKTIDRVKKIGDIKGTFHAEMDTIKDRSVKDLIRDKEIKKRWQKYTELYPKKVLMAHITTIVWPLTKSQTSWSVKSSGLRKHYYKQLVEVMEFQLSYFKS